MWYKPYQNQCTMYEHDPLEAGEINAWSDTLKSTHKSDTDWQIFIKTLPESCSIALPIVQPRLPETKRFGCGNQMDFKHTHHLDGDTFILT